MSFAAVHELRLCLSCVFVLGISAVAGACTPPREGLYTVDNYEPEIRFIEPVNGYLELKRDRKFPSIYTGTPASTRRASSS